MSLSKGMESIEEELLSYEKKYHEPLKVAIKKSLKKH